MISARDVTGYVLDELQDICRSVSLQTAGGDQDFSWQRDALAAERIADEIRRVFSVRLTASELAKASSVVELGVLVQAALSRGRSATAGGDDSESGMPTPPPVNEAVPLSSSQRRIWFMQQLASGTVLYNVPTRLELTGPLVVAGLRAALTDLLARHDILRTCYPVRSGVPRIEVLPPSTAQLPLVDLSDEPSSAATDSEVDRLAEEQASIPFRLEKELPARFLLVRCAAQRHVLIGTFHHIAVDWLTLNLLARDLGALYGRHAPGMTDASPTRAANQPSWQYSDFARREAAELASGALRQAAAARSAALGGAPIPLNLPTDLPRPRFQRFRGNAVSDLLDAPLVAGIRRLARQQRVTPFAVLMAGLVIVLRRAARQPEIVVGTPAAGRTRTEWHDVAGCFINIVPVLTRIADGMSGEQVFSLVSEATWQALEAQDVPFDELVRTMGRNRGASLVTVLFSYQGSRPKIPFPGMADAELTVARPPGTAKYDLSLYVVGHGPELRLELEYDSDLYTAQTADAVLRAYRAELATMLQDPATVIDLDGVSGFEMAEKRAQARVEDSDRTVL